MRRQLCALSATAAIALAFAAGAGTSAPAPPAVDALLQHIDDLYRSKSSLARIELGVTTARSTRNMRVRAWTRGEEEVLVLIEAPPREAGAATLRVGNNLYNPRDQSGIVAPAATYTFNDAVSLLGSVYAPYGRPPEGRLLRSEYGAAPHSGLLQLRVYF